MRQLCYKLCTLNIQIQGLSTANYTYTLSLDYCDSSLLTQFTAHTGAAHLVLEAGLSADCCISNLASASVTPQRRKGNNKVAKRIQVGDHLSHNHIK